MTMESYLSAEDKARVEIDKMLEAAGWAVQDARTANLAASRGVAVREFILEPPHGRADYLLFVDREAVGVIEAKPEGATLPASSGNRRSTSTACPTGSRARSRERCRTRISRPA